MRACIQRVTRAKVSLPLEGNRTAGEIGIGFLVLLGVGVNDGPDEVRLLARKVAGMRIFEDESGKMNKELLDIGGKMLVVSQFTLYANCVHGKRPGFTDAAPPETANRLYEMFVEEVRAKGIEVATGVFQADMSIELVNDGPVTIWLDTEILKS